MDKKDYKTEIINNNGNIKNDFYAKVEVVGDFQVGKTSIFRRLIKNQFIEEYKATEGYEFSPYFIKVDNKVIKFQIWDMCGNENYRN